MRNVFGFLDSFIWIGSGKFSLLSREYSNSAVNVLGSSPEISEVCLNMAEYYWISLIIPESAWISRSDYGNVLNMPHYLR